VNAVSWERTPDRRTWRAARGPVLLTVTKISNGAFVAHVEGLAERSPEFAKRTIAQRWAEEHAGVSK
jgi:hypothetical protein